MHMNEQTLALVVNTLRERGGYQQQPKLVSVADVDFSFDAIFRGPGESESLLVVLAGGEEHTAAIRSKVRALSHTMLRSGSRRPLTLIMVMDQENSAVLEELSRICRVLCVTATNAEEIGDQLRPLLPLELPMPQESQPDAIRQLRVGLGAAAKDSFVASLLAAGANSESEVREVFTNAIQAALEETFEEGTENA